jgi:hypothetical protein
MAARDDAEIRMEGNPEQRPLGDPRQNSEEISPVKVF